LTIATKLTQAGVGMMTWSPSSNNAAMTLASACLAPAEARISAGSYARPLSRASFAQMACLSAMVPLTGV
jgi:hypothetical protein